MCYTTVGTQTGFAAAQGPSCVPWQHCSGPPGPLVSSALAMRLSALNQVVSVPGRCELAQSALTCGKSANQMSLHAVKNESCGWCTMESRCVPRKKSALLVPNVKSNLQDLSTDLGQCIGCDGRFDSGVVKDACGICGGKLALHRPPSPSLNCDALPFNPSALPPIPSTNTMGSLALLPIPWPDISGMLAPPPPLPLQELASLRL